MATQYDEIAEQYKRSKHVSWRYHIEQYTLVQLLGDLSGKSVLDLACGDGHYTRMLKALGAEHVVGADLSKGMIELAEKAESENPMGIEYRVSDARALPYEGEFDLVVAVYLLNYSSTRQDLFEMCRAISRYLKPGGRFIAANNNPSQSPESFEITRKYGFIKLLKAPLTEGAPIGYRFFLGEEIFEIENYYLDPELHDDALRSAGLTDVSWHPAKLSVVEAAGTNKRDWDEFFVDPPVIFLSARKP